MDRKLKFSDKPIEILFEDTSIVIFNKPSGLLVFPSKKTDLNTLIDIVNRQYSSQDTMYKLHPCHRLDRDTSGIIIFAKGKKNQKIIMELFKQKSIVKQYIAFIHGRIQKKRGIINSPVRMLNMGKSNRFTSFKDAITKYKVLETKKDFSIIKAQIITGRTNQIRIHFKSIGHPLVGDRKYSFARDYALKFKRVALHAESISFKHPVIKNKIDIFLKLPKDMEEFIAKHNN